MRRHLTPTVRQLEALPRSARHRDTAGRRRLARMRPVATLVLALILSVGIGVASGGLPSGIGGIVGHP
jgi:hypothetical protein